MRFRDISYSPVSPSKLDVYHPEDLDQPAPMIVFIHGGSWSSGSKYLYSSFANTLREMGYVVIVPDYQKYPLVKADGMYDDIRQAIRWTHKHARKINGDVEMIYVMCGGTSGRTGHNLRRVYNIAEHLEHERKRGVDKISAMARAMGSTKSAFERNSPLEQIRKHKKVFELSEDIYDYMPRILFIHGEEDSIVPYTQSATMYTVLHEVIPKERQDDIDMRLPPYKRLGHAECVTALMPTCFRQNQLAKTLMRDIKEFIDTPESEQEDLVNDFE
ncbi:hypothetical protein EC973_008113 [Apophysomyces ossiformis]|uniref:BD-FAE-like domain-containing protein n=1 Tax=Apophysomyces ossiformis TaxID=679940 RepID=A0A8H7BT84_9FUNG|nr:hypothetical protein EC973_008113 [Apophysomyces ossiformis]